MIRHDRPAPASALPAERRGRTVGRFCRRCHFIYPRFAERHSGKPSLGRDHVGSPCTCEGLPFSDGADWWEPAVEVLPAPVAEAAEAAEAG